MWDSSGVTLARGVEGAKNVSEYISGFVAPTSGTYYARIIGQAGQQYNLTVTRSADYDLEPNNTRSQPQLLTTPQVLGVLDTAPLTIEPDNFTAGTIITNAIPGVTLSTEGYSSTVTAQTSSYTSTGSRVFSYGGSNDWNSSSGWLRADFINPVEIVSIDIIGDDTSDPGILQAYNASGHTRDDGTNILNQITGVSGSGTNFKVTFNSQIVPGIYTMVLGPDIRDVVGNQMDQNGNRISGESGDIFTASVNLLTPDLKVETVDVPSTVFLGQTIDVNWRTSNIGTASATRNWGDRIWFSRDTFKSNDDLLLLTADDYNNSIVAASGGDFTRTVSVKLPTGILNTNGSYYIIVETDAFNNQVESSENNNVGVSQAITFSPTSQPNSLYFNDFESTAGSEWSTTNVDNTYPNTFSRFLGRFSNENTTLTLNTTPGGTYRLEFDFYALDSWEGNNTSSGPDYLNIFLNNTQVFKETFNNVLGNSQTYNLEPNSGSVNNLGFSSAVDSIYRAISIIFTATDSTTQIRFADGGLQGLSDESWGIDNVRVWTDQTANISDLKVESVAAPLAALFGQNIDVNWLVSNIGNVNTTTTWSDRLWLSKDTKLSSDDIPLLSQVQNQFAPLIANGYYTSNATVTISFADILPYEIEGNDSIATANDLSPNFAPSGTNTYVAELGGEISTSYEGDFFKIFASPGDTITLDQFRGSGTLGDTYLYLYNKDGQILAANDDYYGLDSHIVYTFANSNSNYVGDYYIRAGGYSSRTGTYTLKATLQTPNLITSRPKEGTYYILVQSDAPGNQIESDETNNVNYSQ
ncbi:CARDB domain-containing protein, partial [Nostoc sp. CHAB 5715]|uniref:CARDB domain-containing protein n=1 Tax=Nostoc sp. CHAB 5715 TaxID=2780400 RepID=UPI001E3203AD